MNLHLQLNLNFSPFELFISCNESAVFAYHFIPTTTVHHVHYYNSNNNYNHATYYDYRNATTATSATAPKEPVVYDYKPPTNDSIIKDDDNNGIDQSKLSNPNDYFITGVENMLFYGGMKDNQHQVLFLAQGSDGISLENELLLSSFNNVDSFGNEFVSNLQYYPDVEFRFDADDEPNDDDLSNIHELYRNLIENGNC